MINELIKLANQLDSRGLVKEADALDKIASRILKKKAGEYPTFRYSPREGDSASALALMALGDSSLAHLIPQPLEPGKDISLPYLPERAGTTRSFDYKVDDSIRTMTLEIPKAGGITREQDLIDIFGYEAAKGSGFNVSRMLYGHPHRWNSPAVTAMEEAWKAAASKKDPETGYAMFQYGGHTMITWAAGVSSGDSPEESLEGTRFHNEMLDALMKARPNARDAIGRVIHPKIPDGSLPSGDKIAFSYFKEADG
jgi:hypothetical protein